MGIGEVISGNSVSCSKFMYKKNVFTEHMHPVLHSHLTACVQEECVHRTHAPCVA